MSDLMDAISDLSTRIDKRFDTVEGKFDKLDERTRKVERDITKVKTIGSGVAALLAFAGWPNVKLWLISLTK